MRRMVSFTSSLLLVTVLVPFAAASQNDAGLGADAPNSGLGAELPPGIYNGTLDYTAADQDWYRFAGNGTHTVTVRLTSGSGFYTGLYSDSGASYWLGFTYGNTLTFTQTGPVRLRLDNSGTTSGNATYTFTDTIVTQNDAGLETDAPNGGLGAALTPGSYTGDLWYFAGDREDWFRFAGCAGMSVTLSATRGTFYAGLYADDGTLFGNVFVGSGTTVVMPHGPVRLGIGDSAQSTRAAAYSFTATPLPQNDAGSGCDAPDKEPGLVIAKSVMYRGALEYASGDKTDEYRGVALSCQGAQVKVTAVSGDFDARVRGTGLRAIHVPEGGSVLFTVVAQSIDISLRQGPSTAARATYELEWRSFFNGPADCGTTAVVVSTPFF